MRVINIHKRHLSQSKEKVSELFGTLATQDDKIWPSNNWPAIRFKEGLNIGSNGGHGRIRYTITNLDKGHHIKFQFTKPEGFQGYHEFKINAISESSTEVVHKIAMTTTVKASILWFFVIRWLHDALIEEALDNMENHFSAERKESNYNLWVTLLRSYYKRKSFQTKNSLEN